jgi:O-antigen/teichoic acid export membrane protein
MKKNVIYVALSVFGVQGAAYLGQFILAVMLPAEQFAIVRTVEASIQLLSSVAPLGVSLLVVRLAAQTSDVQHLGRSLSSYLAFAILAGIAVAGIFSLIVAQFGHRDADPYLLAMLWVLVLSNISRTGLNFLYGKEHFATVSFSTFLIALCYLAVLIALVKLSGLAGWIGAKYIIEVALALLSLAFVWRQLGPIIMKTQLYVSLACEGLALSMSLLFRTGLDTLPLLLLAYFGASSKDLATFGLCTLMVTAAMIIPASLNTVLLPKIVQVIKNDPHSIQAVRQVYVKQLIIAGIILVIILFIFGIVLENQLNSNYANLSSILTVLSLLIPIKLICTINSHIIFALNKTAINTIINGFTLIICIFLCFMANGILDQSNLILAFAVIMVVCELIALTQFVAIGNFLIKKI